MAQYSVNNYTVENLLGFIKAGDIAIPEIQRPFVWDGSKVRDLLDSLYQGYPIGYIIVWQNPDVKLKDGTVSTGKKVLIDGQQRIMSLSAAIVGQEVTGEDYKKHRIIIAFNPQTEKFEVSNNALEKSPAWITDVADVFSPSFRRLSFLREYGSLNNLDDAQVDEIDAVITRLLSIQNNSLGVIVLDQNLDIDKVTDIFIRINSKGVVLSQADFVMSKISANEEYGGNITRKCIDYFCHLFQRPEDLGIIRDNDTQFSATPEYKALAWVAKETEDIYQTSYTDVLRVAFTSTFGRGRLADLVALLSGRNFTTREYQGVIAEESFKKLHDGVMDVINKTNFQRYIMILKPLGVVNGSLIRSQNVLNFGYILYLVLRRRGIEDSIIGKLVRRWVIITILTGRYSGSPESEFDYDVKRFMSEENPADFVDRIEAGELSDAFWDSVLPMRLNTSVASSPYFNIFLMAQCKAHDRGFLSDQIRVEDMLDQRGDIHHLFPKAYLIRNHIDSRGQYNQIANYVLLQSEINTKIKDAAPKTYMAGIWDAVREGKPGISGIVDEKDLRRNLEEACIPEGFSDMTFEDYDRFLDARRILMVKKIRAYYESLK